MASFFQFFLDDGKTLRSEHRLLLRSTPGFFSNSLAGNIPPWPINWTRAPNGWLYFTNGLMQLLRWDGVRNEAVVAGVPAPTTALTLGSSGTGSLTGTYTAYTRFLDEDGNPSSLSPVSNEITVSGVGRFDYTGVPVPTSARITRKQILRNTNGQAQVYYVAVDTTDVAGTTFSDALTDSQLQTQTAFALFDFKGNPQYNRYGFPRDDKPIVVSYYDRLFLAGSVTYDEGHVEVTRGSTTVQGVGTQFVGVLAGRQLYVVGADKAYTISSVDVTNQTLTLSEPYRSATDLFGVYAVRSSPAVRNTIYFSQPSAFDAWSEFNGLTIREEDDEITGMMVAHSFLWIFMKRKLHRLTFHRDVIIDGGVFIAALRGCVNNRCWAYVDGITYALDEEGVYRFMGSHDSEPISTPVQNIFWLEHLPGDLHVNWEPKAVRFWHCLYHKEEHTIRWYVSLSGQRLPRHALCFNHRTEQWWVEEYPFPLGASYSLDTQVPRPLVAGPARRVLAQGVGTTDGPDPAAGKTRGTLTAATYTTITDGSGIWPATNVTGWPVSIYDGAGKGQTRIIHTVSSQVASLTQPWLVKPDTTSKYQLGGIGWQWKSGWFQFAPSHGEQDARRLVMHFQPTGTPAQMDLRFYLDNQTAPEDTGATWPPTPAESTGWTATRGSEDILIDLNFGRGFVQVRMDDGRDRYQHGADFVAVELRGFSCESQVRVYGLTFEGVKE